MARPMLGDLELEQVQLVESDEDQVVVRHHVPALETDLLQDLGRRGARLTLSGVLSAPPRAEHLADLRRSFLAGDPVPFVSDISTATAVDQVLVERMEVREVAGRPEALEYHLTLRELTEAEPVDTDDVVIPPPPPPTVTDGKLAVTVVVEGDPAFDMARVRVSVHGTQADGTPLDRVLTERVRPDTWFADPFPAGDYTAQALVDDDATPTGQRETLTGSATVRVVEGETATVTIVLRRGARVATVFVVHFDFDKAFVEPCMRRVLAEVVAHLAADPDLYLAVVGHTDLTGGDEYNQALSERRARAVYAMLTFGSAPDRSVAEWDELRRARPTGTITTVKDTWGTVQVQHMLQALGRFQGNVGGDPGLTDQAIRQYQSDRGLTPDGVVGDATWPVLIRDYLADAPLDLPVDRLVRNTDGAGCDNGPLRWIGCGEQDPVLNVTTAWRPNRRTELIAVREDRLPAAVPEPITLDQVPQGAGGGGWCLDDGTATAVDAFVVPWGTACPNPPAPAWCRSPAEPATAPVAGRIHFEDGSPFHGTYVLTAADGEYLGGEVPTTSTAAHAGEPFHSRTGPDGELTFPAAAPHKSPGVFTVAVDGPFLVRAPDQGLADVRGNATCLRPLLADLGALDVVVVDRSVASVQPVLGGPDLVVVRKPHTAPARRPVELRVTGAFTGSGRLDRSSDAVRLFDAPAGGTEITFDGVDNVFTDAQLVAGVTLFAEGARASAAVGDVVLTLVLTVGGTPGLSASYALTSVDVGLDLHASRTVAGTDPAALSEAQKITPGRFVQVQDAGNHAGRAMITVRQPVPAGVVGTLVLTPLDARTRLFAAADEVAAAGQVPVPTPVRLPVAGVPATGTRFWVEGAAVSGALRDTALQLGLDGVEADGDRVQLTVVELSALTLTVPGTPARTARLGNSPVAAHVVAGPAVPVPADFDEDPVVNPPLALVEGSVAAANPVVVTVSVRPAGVPVLFSRERATGIAAASGGDDAPAVVALTGGALPTLVRDPATPGRATLLADSVGTFHVRAFVDGNGNGTFEHRVDREPSILRTVVLGRVTLVADNTIARSANFRVTPTAGNGISVSSGVFNIAAPATAAIHTNATVDLVTGGADGRRLAGQFFGGWINNETAAEVVAGTFVETVGGAPVVHSDPSVFASNVAAATVVGVPPDTRRVFLPADPAPVPVATPLLDSGRGSLVVGRGGNSATLTRSQIRPPRAPRPVGERWIVEAVDSPGDSEPGTHFGFPAATLRGFHFELTFSATLAVWTASTGAVGDPADRAYAVLTTVSWRQLGEWTVNPADGSIAVVTAPTTTVTASVPTSPAVPAAGTGVEVRFPAGTDLLARDART